MENNEETKGKKVSQATKLCYMDEFNKALEEERRLFYVAMTRARKYLYVLCPQRTDGESTFVTELKKIAEQAD